MTEIFEQNKNTMRKFKINDTVLLANNELGVVVGYDNFNSENKIKLVIRVVTASRMRKEDYVPTYNADPMHVELL